MCSKVLSSIFLGLPLIFLIAARDSAAQIPKVEHVIIVLEENTDYADVCGPNHTGMPFLCGLKSQGSFSANYYSPTHPSIGNYESLAWGEVTTNDDNCLPTNCGFPYTGDNIVRAVDAVKKTWKGYAESLPSACYFGGNSGEYAVRHSPIPYISDVESNCLDRYVAFEDSKLGFAHDLALDTLPSFALITPDLCDDAHSCPLPGSSIPDEWLKSKVIQPLLNSGHLNATTGDSVLIVTFDESGHDNTNGGGLVYWFMIGKDVKKNYKSTGPHVSPGFYSHDSTLRVIAELLGASISGLGRAATAPDMTEFFGGSSPAHTDTTLASNHNPSTPGELVTFTAHVTVAAPGSRTPTGEVIFYNGSAAMDTVGLGSNGEVAFETSSLPAGSHDIAASYRGDANFLPSGSTALIQEVRNATTTTATASANFTVYGQPVTFDATVSSKAAETITGTVSFRDAATVRGSETVSGDRAKYVTSTLSVGTHSITAEYSGNASFGPSTSIVLDPTVNKATTTAKLTSSANPSTLGASVTFKVTVTAVAPGTGRPTGTMTFKNGKTTLGTVTLANGAASYSTAKLATGNHSITAVYAGSSDYMGITSSVLTQAVH